MHKSSEVFSEEALTQVYKTGGIRESPRFLKTFVMHVKNIINCYFATDTKANGILKMLCRSLSSKTIPAMSKIF